MYLNGQTTALLKDPKVVDYAEVGAMKSSLHAGFAGGLHISELKHHYHHVNSPGTACCKVQDMSKSELQTFIFRAK